MVFFLVLHFGAGFERKRKKNRKQTLDAIIHDKLIISLEAS
jgi:transcriptional antiterminator